MSRLLFALLGTFTLGACRGGEGGSPGTLELLNVSYDPTRELYTEINAAFARRYQADTGRAVRVSQSHGGSGKQARSVLDGLEADVVTLALGFDIDALARGSLLPAVWRSRLPHDSAPLTSTIVFVVRAGNPKGVRSWEDLGRPGVAVITPNPKTSGGARWNYLAAYGHALRSPGGTPETAQALLAAIFQNVPVLDSGARGATTTFAERGIGDVLVTWENEAYLLTEKVAKGRFEIVTPSDSILAEPPVAWVDAYVDRHGTRAAAEAYLRFLYTDEAQRIGLEHFYRPTSEALAGETARRFAATSLFTIEELFGGWDAAQRDHFADGGSFDRIYSRVAAAGR